MLVKGWLTESNKTCLTDLSVIIHKVTHGDIKRGFAYARSDARYLTANQHLHFFAT